MIKRAGLAQNHPASGFKTHPCPYHSQPLGLGLTLCNWRVISRIGRLLGKVLEPKHIESWFLFAFWHGHGCVAVLQHAAFARLGFCRQQNRPALAQPWQITVHARAVWIEPVFGRTVFLALKNSLKRPVNVINHLQAACFIHLIVCDVTMQPLQKSSLLYANSLQCHCLYTHMSLNDFIGWHHTKPLFHSIHK